MPLASLFALATFATSPRLANAALAHDVPVFAATVAAGDSTGDAAAPSTTPTAGPRGTVSFGDDSGKPKPRASVGGTHSVQKGDTLWDICETFFGNPWQWPRVWSYNPEIVNPHWIYPGQLIRLKEGAGGASGTATSAAPAMGAGGKVGAELRPRLVPSGTVFISNHGFMYDDRVEDVGEIIGSPTEKLMLAPYDQAYVRVTDDEAKSLSPGDKLTIFEAERELMHDGKPIGKVVTILGTLRVDTIDKSTRLATATIVEGLDVIERGARIGPIDRRLDIVPPTTNTADVKGKIIASIEPNILFGQNQVVLIDKGSDAGLATGNRLFVTRRGDAWRQGLSAGGALAAAKLSLGTEGPPVGSSIDTPADSPDFPDEVVAELRVIRVRKGTSTCVLTSSTLEVEPDDHWVAKKGY